MLKAWKVIYGGLVDSKLESNEECVNSLFAKVLSIPLDYHQ